jgi:hypothetical protein
MKYLVVGGRFFHRLNVVEQHLLAIFKAHRWPSLIIHGDRLGCETLAGEWARAMLVPTKEIPAWYALHGQTADATQVGAMMREKPDLVIAFTSGSPATNMAIAAAQMNGVPVLEVAI